MGRISLDEITVTQNGVHTVEQIHLMTEFVQQGGFFTQELLKEWAITKHIKTAPPIKITVFEDGAKYLHDGHHRCIAIFLGGRTYLDPREYVIEHWTYDDYEQINFEHGWVTPLNVKTHVRLPDIKDYKQSVMSMYFGATLTNVDDFIRQNTHHYRVERDLYTIEDLAGKINFYDSKNIQANLVGCAEAEETNP